MAARIIRPPHPSSSSLFIAFQAPTIAQLKAVGTKYVQRLPQAGDSRYYQKAAIQKQPAASASEFVFEMEAGQAGDESFNPATQSVVEEPVAAEVQKEMAKDRPVTAPSYKARAGLNPASVYQVGRGCFSLYIYTTVD